MRRRTDPGNWDTASVSGQYVKELVLEGKKVKSGSLFKAAQGGKKQITFSSSEERRF